MQLLSPGLARAISSVSEIQRPALDSSIENARYRHAYQDHHKAADHVVPEKRNVREQVGGKDGCFTGDYAEERAVCPDAAEEERQHEHAEQPSIEQRSDYVHGLDQSAEVLAILREAHREAAPKYRSDA
jgi:hypothetical protein